MNCIKNVFKLYNNVFEYHSCSLLSFSCQLLILRSNKTQEYFLHIIFIFSTNKVKTFSIQNCSEIKSFCILRNKYDKRFN